MAMSKENAIIKDGILYEVMEGSCLSCDMSKHCVTSPHKPCKVFGDNVRLVIQREYMHLYVCLSEEIIKTPEYDKEDDEFTGDSFSLKALSETSIVDHLKMTRVLHNAFIHIVSGERPLDVAFYVLEEFAEKNLIRKGKTTNKKTT